MATHEEIEETLNILRNAWQKAPMLRLGQLMSNAAAMSKWEDPDLFYLSDAWLKNGLKNFIKKEF